MAMTWATTNQQYDTVLSNCGKMSFEPSGWNWIFPMKKTTKKKQQQQQHVRLVGSIPPPFNNPLMSKCVQKIETGG